MIIVIDSRSPKYVLTMVDSKKILGRTGIELKQKNNEDHEFWDYKNNRISLLGKVDVELESNGCKKRAEIRVIGGIRPSIVRRELMGKLVLPLMQKNQWGAVMNMQRVEDARENEQTGEAKDQDMDPSNSTSVNFLLEPEKYCWN